MITYTQMSNIEAFDPKVSSPVSGIDVYRAAVCVVLASACEWRFIAETCTRVHVYG